jgi:hypothetical protein
MFVVGFTAANAAIHNAMYAEKKLAEETTTDQSTTPSDISQFKQKTQTTSGTGTTNKAAITISSPANNAVVEKANLTIKLSAAASGDIFLYDITSNTKIIIASSSLKNAQTYSVSGALLTEMHQYRVEFVSKDETSSKMTTIQTTFTVNSLKAVPLKITSPANSSAISMTAIKDQNASVKISGPQSEVKLECVLSTESGTVISEYTTTSRTIPLKNFSGIKPGKYVLTVTGTNPAMGSSYPETDKQYLNFTVTAEEKTDTTDKTDTSDNAVK